MKIWFTTVVRGAEIEKGGSLFELDTVSRKIKLIKKIIPTSPDVIDANPRGSSRGGRGIQIINEEVFVANYHTIEVFNKSGHFLRKFSNKIFAGIHEISRKENNLLISSTSNDLVIETDIYGKTVNIFEPRNNPIFQKELSILGNKIDLESDQRLVHLSSDSFSSGHIHLNCVSFIQGNIYALLNREGSIIDLTNNKVFLRHQSLIGSHNIEFFNEHFWVNNTLNGSLLKINKEGVIKDDIKIAEMCFGSLGSSVARVNYLARRFLQKTFKTNQVIGRPFFMRGLAPLSNNLLCIGTSPATLILFDEGRNFIVDYFKIESNVNHCIHGICQIN